MNVTKSYPRQNYFNLAFIVVIAMLLWLNLFIKKERIAYVDSSKILAEFVGAKDVKKAFELKAKGWQNNIDSLTDEIKNSIKKHEEELSGMSAKEQQLSRQILSAKQKQLIDYQQAIRDNAQRENGKSMQVVISKINSYLAKYGKEHGYKLILIANQSGTIAYAEENLDITKDVLDGLNSLYGK